MQDLWVMVNGKMLPRELAVLPVEDRGLIFADSIYEVIHFYNGNPFYLEDHLDRLEQSAVSIMLRLPFSRDEIRQAVLLCARRNEIRDGSAYLQVTRGTAPRNHSIPHDISANWFIICRPSPPFDEEIWQRGFKLITVDDFRWHYASVKSTGLLANILAKQNALAQGADDAAFVLNDCITETSSANLFCFRNGCLWTYPTDGRILPGITRKIVLSLAAQMTLATMEKPLPVQDWLQADEAFLAGTLAEITPVSAIDGVPIGSKTPGKLTQKIRESFDRHKALQGGTS